MISKRDKVLIKIKNNLKKVHGNIVSLDETTYVNTRTRARFIDKDYGEWWAAPRNVIYLKQGHKIRGYEKRKITYTERYGVDNPLKSKKIQDKRKKTLLKKYGVEHVFQISGINDKRKKTCLEKYGVECILQNKDIMKKAMLIKYGVEHPMFLEETKEKIKKTLSKRYGIQCSFQCEKTKKTLMEKYGVDHISKVKNVQDKISKSMNNSGIIEHWKTNEECIWVGSYEKRTIEYFNKNKIDYSWQPKIFQMPGGKTYRPDCYLIDEDKWIEIKGYFRKDAKEKWDWFHEECPNSELWDMKKLKDTGIL